MKTYSRSLVKWKERVKPINKPSERCFEACHTCCGISIMKLQNVRLFLERFFLMKAGGDKKEKNQPSKNSLPD